MPSFKLSKERNSMIGTRTRVQDSCESGLCPICIADCPVFCEVSKSAIRGREVLYPLREYFGMSTAGTPKDFGLSFADFQIMFEVRGAKGIEQDMDRAIFPNVNIESTWGNIKIKTPVVIAGLGSTDIAKRNWESLAYGASLAGIPLTVGENVCGMDPNAKYSDSKPYPKVLETEDMARRVKLYREYWDGVYGDIIIQRNVEDTRGGVFDYVISKLDVTSVEEKFGQGAKAIGGEVRLTSLEKAQLLKKRGYLVIPDPMDPQVIEDWKAGLIPDFERHSRVGITSTVGFLENMDRLRSSGIKNIFIKTGAYRPSATAWIIRLAVEGKADGITFDGAGGGTGMSPVSMMNEGSIPTVYLEALVVGCLDRICKAHPHVKIPDVAIAGGIADETQMFKALALGAPYVKAIAMARAPITAVMKGKWVGDQIQNKQVNKAMLNALGFPDSKDPASLTVEEAFVCAKELKNNKNVIAKAKELPTGAIGVYTYIANKLHTGLKQLLAGVRKFQLRLIDRQDIACISERAFKVCSRWELGIPMLEDLDFDEAIEEIDKGSY